MDFRNASRLFADPEFDGDPISIIDIGEDDPIPVEPEPTDPPSGDDGGWDDPGDPGDDPPTPRFKYRVNDVEVKIINERVQYYDKDGKLITESITNYSKKNILGEYATLDDFLQAWRESERKQAIIDELKERGVLLDALKEAAGNRDIDDFDLICHIAFDKKPLTKKERADGVRKRDYLNQYEGIAREVLSALLDKYAENGIEDVEDVKILQIDPFRAIGDVRKIIGAFGSKVSYLHAVRQLEDQIYKAA
jgi:type I restriction enzyme R subunit